ncbi:hypothetical protein [Micromonospora sp. NPDC000442]|uniref:hypothetical protein n=1 Tax=Micromonospora sp. NPDC000442 TaxID=3364217 RepID=UPI00369E836A
MTLFVMVRGRTVQQPTAFAFALMPNRFGHLCRMYLRWMRGSFIRSWWRVRRTGWGTRQQVEVVLAH